MKKELKLTILDTVSTLSNLFVKLKSNSETKTSKIRELEAEVTKVKADLHMAAGKPKRQVGHYLLCRVGYQMGSGCLVSHL
jgi:hypothetical protein